jgi:lysophospholipase L1-like esterase
MHGIGAASKTRGRSRLFRSSTPVPVGSTSPVGVTRVYTAPMILPRDVGAFTLRGANRTYAAGAGASVTVDFANYSSDGAGSPTGTLLTSLLSKTLPGDGTVATIGQMRAAPGSDKRTVLQFNFPNPTFSHIFPTLTFGQYAESTSDVTTIPTFTGTNPDPVYWLWLEYLTSKRRIVVIGDSISAGYACGWDNAAWNQLAASKDIAVCIEGVVQYGSYLNFDPSTNPALWDMLADIIPGADVVVQLGTNDLNYNDLPTMENAAKLLFAYIRRFSPRTLRGWTVFPAAGYPGTDTVRTSFNADFLANFKAWGLDGVYDAAASRLATVPGMADDVNPLVMYSGYDSGDGSHPNTAGQTVIASAWTKALSL